MVVSWVEAGCAVSSQGSWQEGFVFFFSFVTSETWLRICFPFLLKVSNPFCAAVSWHAFSSHPLLYTLHSAMWFPWAPCCFQDKKSLIPSMDLICSNLHQSQTRQRSSWPSLFKGFLGFIWKTREKLNSRMFVFLLVGAWIYIGKTYRNLQMREKRLIAWVECFLLENPGQ